MTEADTIIIEVDFRNSESVPYSPSQVDMHKR